MEGYSSAISLRGIADDETVGPMRSLFETVFRPQPFQPVCANLIVETGHFPSWPLIEIRRPCNSSSQTFSTVPAFPSVRTTALPTSSDRASSSAPRIVNAWSFAVGMVASEIRPCEGCGSRRRRLRTRRPHSRSDTGPGHQEFEWLSCMRCCNRSADHSRGDHDWHRCRICHVRLCQPGRRASTDWKGVTFGQAPQNSHGA
jgi:hypothetical protein